MGVHCAIHLHLQCICVTDQPTIQRTRRVRRSGMIIFAQYDIYTNDAHRDFHCPQHQDRPGRENVSKVFFRLFAPGAWCMALSTWCMVPVTRCWNICTWHLLPGAWFKVFFTWYLISALLTWYLICMTLSSLQVSISEGGCEHCLSAPPY